MGIGAPSPSTKRGRWVAAPILMVQIPPPFATQTTQASLWWPNKWSLVAEFENVRRADALRAALRPPPPGAEPPPPPKKSRQQ